MPNAGEQETEIEEDPAEGFVLEPVLVAGDEPDEREVPGERSDPDGRGEGDGPPPFEPAVEDARRRPGHRDPEHVEGGIREIEQEDAEDGLGRRGGDLVPVLGDLERPGVAEELAGEQEDDHGGRALDVSEGVGRQGDLDLEEAGQGDEQNATSSVTAVRPASKPWRKSRLSACETTNTLTGPTGTAARRPAAIPMRMIIT